LFFPPFLNSLHSFFPSLLPSYILLPLFLWRFHSPSVDGCSLSETQLKISYL
jgi:hypothetical protein